MHTEDKHCAMRWIPSSRTGASIDSLRHYRIVLDRLSAKEVIWVPYEKRRQIYPFFEVFWYSVSMSCMDIVESYHVTRVLRQFGRVQTITEPLIKPRSWRSRGNTGNTYKPDYAYIDYHWEHWQHHIVAPTARSGVVVNPWDTSDDYLGWYYHISHPIVVNPVDFGAFDAPSTGVVSESDRLCEDNTRPRHRVSELEERMTSGLTISSRFIEDTKGSQFERNIILLHNTLFPEHHVEMTSNSGGTSHPRTYKRRQRNAFMSKLLISAINYIMYYVLNSRIYIFC